MMLLPNALGMKDVAGIDYFYDVNGNIILDNNKNISDIVYNFMNKPQAITFTDGKSLYYTYDAAGNKLAVELKDGSTSMRKTEYSGAFEYKNGNLEQIHSGDGKIVPGIEGWEYNYHLSFVCMNLW